MPKTLLLADDSVTIQKVVGITFANEDVELVTVDNGDDALVRAREVRPDLVMADVSMPGLTGYELCAALKREPDLASVPVLLLTGTFETYDADRASEVGADAYIAKPFEAQALVDQVHALLNRPAALPAPEPVPAELPPVAPAALPAPTPMEQPRAAAPTPPREVPQPHSVSAPRAAPVLESSPEPLPLPEPSTPVRPSPEPLPLPEPPTPRPAAPVEPRAGVAAPPLEALPQQPLPPLEPPSMDSPAFADPAPVLAPKPAPAAERVAPQAPPPAAANLAEATPSAGATPPPELSFSDMDLRGPSATEPTRVFDEPGLAPELGALPDLAAPDLHAEPEAVDRTSFFDPLAEQPARADHSMGEPPSTPSLDIAARDFDPLGQGPDHSDFDLSSPEEPLRPPAPLDPFESDSTAPSAIRSGPPPAMPEQEIPWAEPLGEEPSDAHAEIEPLPIAEPIDSPFDVAETAPASIDLDADALREALEKVAWEAFGPLSEQLVREVVVKVEEIAWEVVPQLAERLIRDELERIKKEGS